MRLTIRLVLLAIALNAGSFLQAQNKVLIIGIDGCRPDGLLAAKTPNLDKIWENGAYSFSAQTDPISSSGICWTAMLTGVWHEKHNVLTNEYKDPNIGEYPHFYRRVKEQKPDLKLYSIVNWSPIHKILQKGDADIVNYLLSDEKVTQRVVDLLQNDNPDAVFVQLDEVDGAGHRYDYVPESSEYLKAIEKADELVGSMITAIKRRELIKKENWLILVSTDHGGSKKGHGKDIPEHTTIFFIANGNDVQKGKIKQQVNVVDVAVTALEHLGIESEEDWNLDGKVIGIR
ncbi:alkaline phosphatase family protein [Sunxiuqinia rutila]|uniref:alkaline phosphatase family protein n=1 Tax=Sunxiuqinia rutila TaxID=1397841 RepID=UPI003D36C0BF